MAEFIPWESFLPTFEWRQGEHVSLIGPTGCGKTTLGLSLMPLRGYSVIFGTKPADSTLDKMLRGEWTRIRSWSDRPPIRRQGQPELQRLVLWPPFNKIEDIQNHAYQFDRALREIYQDGRWAVFVDEAKYLSKDLGLEQVMRTMWQQGRSLKVSVVAATQRPAWVPLELYSEATHLFFWRANDKRALERLRDISGDVNGREIEATIRSLDFKRHEVLYVNTRTGEQAITIPPKNVA